MSDDNDTPDIEVEEAPRKKRRSSSRRKVAQPGSASYAADCSYKERPLFEPGKCCCAACLRLRG